MQTHQLIPHPATPPALVSAIEARVNMDDPRWVKIRWRIEHPSSVIVPPIRSKSRADGLWQTTCFELFIQPRGQAGYHEWNFAPSRQWNAYAFTDVRDGMRPLDVARNPDTQWHGGSAFALFDVFIARGCLPTTDCDLGITAVIEEEGDRKSYWALAHGQPNRPDFHDPACFTASLAAPRVP